MRRGTQHALLCTTVLWAAGCAMVPIDHAAAPQQALPTLQGSYHQVRPGETLWRIAHSYGVDVQRLASVNRLGSANQVAAGQRLFIPLPVESDQFLWPVRGSVGTSGGSRALEIATAPGSLVRASRSGRVAVATQQLSGWGKTIVLDHLDGYLTVYAGLGQLLVSPGADVRQGTPIGSLASKALHFEIRQRARITDALTLLPRE